jgi:hypothetical protein
VPPNRACVDRLRERHRATGKTSTFVTLDTTPGSYRVDLETKDAATGARVTLRLTIAVHP